MPDYQQITYARPPTKYFRQATNGLVYILLVNRTAVSWLQIAHRDHGELRVAAV